MSIFSLTCISQWISIAYTIEEPWLSYKASMARFLSLLTFLSLLLFLGLPICWWLAGIHVDLLDSSLFLSVSPSFGHLANCYLLSILGSGIISSKKHHWILQHAALELSVYLSLLVTVEDWYSLMYLSSLSDYKFIKSRIIFITFLP